MTVPCTRTDPDIELANCYQKHEPISVGLKLVSIVPGVLHDVEYETHTGADVVSWFLERILAYRDMVHGYLFDDKRLIMTEDNTRDFNAAKICHICEEPFPDQNNPRLWKGSRKVRDHDHISGAFRVPHMDIAISNCAKRTTCQCFCTTFVDTIAT